MQATTELTAAVEAFCDKVMDDMVTISHSHHRLHAEMCKVQELATCRDTLHANMPDVDLGFLDDAIRERRAALNDAQDDTAARTDAVAKTKEALVHAIQLLNNALEEVKKRRWDAEANPLFESADALAVGREAAPMSFSQLLDMIDPTKPDPTKKKAEELLLKEEKRWMREQAVPPPPDAPPVPIPLKKPLEHGDVLAYDGSMLCGWSE